MAGIGVQPYWELTFDAEGDVDPHERELLVQGVLERNLTDLVLFAHGWNNDRSSATDLYHRFYAPFPALLGHASRDIRLGYGGVIWPSMRFTDEPIPHFPPQATGAAAGPGLPPGTREALLKVFPGSRAVVNRLAELAEEQPEDRARLEEFVSLVRTLVSEQRRRVAVAGAAPDAFVPDLEPPAAEPPGAEPVMLTEDAERVCARFADALERTGARTAALFGSALQRLWGGALEVLRQGSYWEMKRRAGTVGQCGLGPALTVLARSAPGLRVHLAGHSFGARLVSFALRALPDGAGAVHSVTLLQGAFSHYVFAPRLPFDHDRAGVLRGLEHRVDGPLVCCYSRHDTALGVFYPLASMMVDDTASLFGRDDDRWGALGHDGVLSVTPVARIPLERALAGALPSHGFASVDTSGVVRHGGPPTGAHGDICHPELARLILVAGRIVR
ncbi:serine-threonine protein kinase [Streptomyces sp. NPDC002536]